MLLNQLTRQTAQDIDCAIPRSRLVVTEEVDNGGLGHLQELGKEDGDDSFSFPGAPDIQRRPFSDVFQS